MTTRQREALRAQRTLAERLRVWREERRNAAIERNTKRRKAERVAREGKRGIDRVPDKVKVAGLQPVQLVAHEHPTYRYRRNVALFYGSGLATGKNQPHVNPDKDRRLAGKARRRARRTGATS